jgi:FkbM family methyltransferase
MRGMLRRIAERCSRGVVLRRRLPPQFGRRTVFVSPDASLKHARPGPVRSELYPLVERLVGPDEQVWDIGANIGLFAIPAAVRARAGGVLAVEPDPFLAGLVRASIARPENRDLRVEVVCCAISDRIGIGAFAIAARGRASNFLLAAGGLSNAGGVRERLACPLLTLDALLADATPPTLLKIDVEGAEDAVLAGGGRVLQEVRPRILVEVGREAVEAVTSRLHASDYVLFDADRPEAASQPLDRCVWNTLALPAEQAPPRE